MGSSWSYTLAGPDAYLLHFGTRPVAQVVWIRDLLHPSNTLARIVDGLNTPAGDPGRVTWEIRHVSTDPMRGDLLHNGLLFGELAWIVDPTHHDRAELEQRVTNGLNRPEQTAGTPVPEPAPRHLSIVKGAA
jgi:hypothetical protein